LFPVLLLGLNPGVSLFDRVPLTESGSMSHPKSGS